MSGADPHCRVAGPDVALRTALRASDAQAIREIVTATSMFTPAEVDVAIELVQDGLARGDKSDYAFAVAEREGRVIGYACYGAIPCTVASYDLYWIAVDPALQRSGVGRRLLSAAEDRIRRAGGTRIYVDTAGRAAYDPTRRFYERAGYRREAVLPDFYAPGDAKVIYVKLLSI